jgi:hypothetical protein
MWLPFLRIVLPDNWQKSPGSAGVNASELLDCPVAAL